MVYTHTKRKQPKVKTSFVRHSLPSPVAIIAQSRTGQPLATFLCACDMCEMWHHWPQSIYRWRLTWVQQTRHLHTYTASLQAVNGRRFLVHIVLYADSQDDKQVQCRHSPLHWHCFWTEDVYRAVSAASGMVLVFGSPMPLGPVFQELWGVHNER